MREQKDPPAGSRGAVTLFVAVGLEPHYGAVTGGAVIENDLENMSREELVAEVQRLRDGIRRHRDSSGHELCWHHPALWGLLPDKTDPLPVVPDWPQFLRGCVRYRESLDEQLPTAPRSDDEHDA